MPKFRQNQYNLIKSSLTTSVCTYNWFIILTFPNISISSTIKNVIELEYFPWLENYAFDL